MDLGGKQIIGWIIAALEGAGITEIVIVTGFRPGLIKAALARRGGGRTPEQRATGRRGAKVQGAGQARVRYVHNPKWRLPNGLSLYAARKEIRGGESFLLLMSDHLLPASVVRRVAVARSARCLLAVDTDLARVFDLSDATKVRIRGRTPVAIGKRLRSYNAVDCGLFRLDRRVFTALEAAFSEGELSLTGGIKRLIAAGDLEVLPIGKHGTWIDIDTPKAYRQAQRHLGSSAGRISRAQGRQTCKR
jgi:choline kinase